MQEEFVISDLNFVGTVTGVPGGQGVPGGVYPGTVPGTQVVPGGTQLPGMIPGTQVPTGGTYPGGVVPGTQIPTGVVQGILLQTHKIKSVV